MKKLLIAIFFFYAHVAISDSNVSQNKLTNSYIECNLEGFRQSRTPIDKTNFVAESSIAHLVHELLVARNKELSMFIASKNKMSDPDYVDQAMEFFSWYLESELQCFRNVYQEGDDVYKFQQEYESGGRVEGFAVANTAVKAVLYTTVISE